MMLLDSNIIIYSFQPQHAGLLRFIADHAPLVSAISYVEVAGFPGISPEELERVDAFFDRSPVIPVDLPVIRRAAQLRQQRRMSVGDSIIAATALLNDVPLATRNTIDFRWIDALRLVDPFQ